MEKTMGISRCVKIFVRENSEGEVKNIMYKNLIEFCEWYERAKKRNAEIYPNGMTGMIVITNNRYFVAEVM